MALQLNSSLTDHSVSKILSQSDVPDTQVNKRKRVRRGPIHFQEGQKETLEKTFTADRYPDIRTRERLAHDLGVSESRIQVWFQNRRSRFRRSQMGKTPAEELKKCSYVSLTKTNVSSNPVQNLSYAVPTYGYPDHGLLSYCQPGPWTHNVSPMYPMYRDLYQPSLYLPSPYYPSPMVGSWASQCILSSDDSFHRAETRAADLMLHSSMLSPCSDVVTVPGY